MHLICILLLENAFISTLAFLYLVLRARIRTIFLFRENTAIIMISSLLGYVILDNMMGMNTIAIMSVTPLFVVSLIVLLTLFRFYRNPERKCNSTKEYILAPADGFVSYIKRIESAEIPFSIKGKDISKLSELSKVDVLGVPCWLIGITMTLFDVHYIRAPISGQVVLNQHTAGKFLSLKIGNSEVENERNTSVIEGNQQQIGVIQIASKRVRGIRTFIEKGQCVQMGQRIGMITFGSQTDIIFPIAAIPVVSGGEWVYGGKTRIASFDPKSDHDEYSM